MEPIIVSRETIAPSECVRKIETNEESSTGFKRGQNTIFIPGY
jgi:hypothetical protein